MVSQKLNADLSTAEWRKSTHSGSEGGNCVEVAVNLPGVVAVRDSKRGDGPALIVTAAAWRSFIRETTAREA
ncbi:hypothetical protein Sme01_62310 [Sphaerisporangium melleum]|uniref:DUF397 domain-containing protein n=1 Tax=Sphaerisporangium melleum TaxID=321316 RepID=A0A917RBV8_9ACTN|nr:DUF397 domain-containing protein [Sphaerisporangium melleum]GGK98566.1 hypothetical protein GCM10007964_45930 [Sphaerisporangium melleum]GII73755.1 hypothetical protein Sme01_62310 [Sphaerisporangium melleum]